MADEYTCAHCGGVFEKVEDERWSDEKALQEMQENFGDTEEQLAVVCDDCYQAMFKVIPPATYRQSVDDSRTDG